MAKRTSRLARLRSQPPARRLPLTLILALAALVLFLAGCATDHPLDTFSADAGPSSERITNLFRPVLGVAIVVFILVEGAIIYMIRRFRANRNSAAGDPYDPDNPQEITDEPLPEQVHGNLRLEIAWTIIPTIILVVVAAFTLVVIFDLEEVTAEDDDLRVTVVGQQWWWEFQYHLDGDTSSPPNFVTVGELVIPVNQQVPLELASRDVIHAYWIPQLKGKKDAVPGRSHDHIIEAYRPGRYKGQCTEFCGLAHAWMKMYTVALPEPDWQAWAENQKKPVTPLTEGQPGFEGQELFMANCARCHSISGLTDTNGDEIIDNPSIYSASDKIHDQLEAGAAPDLTHLMSRSTFAGSYYDLYEDGGEDLPYLDLANSGKLNVVELQEWIANAPASKPADWRDGRGMPPFANLTDEDLDHLVEYLSTLT